MLVGLKLAELCGPKAQGSTRSPLSVLLGAGSGKQLGGPRGTARGLQLGRLERVEGPGK